MASLGGFRFTGTLEGEPIEVQVETEITDAKACEVELSIVAIYSKGEKIWEKGSGLDRPGIEDLEPA